MQKQLSKITISLPEEMKLQLLIDAERRGLGASAFLRNIYLAFQQAEKEHFEKRGS